MATTPEILEIAKKLGKMIKEHAAAAKLEDAISILQKDTDAQRLMNDYNRLTAEIAEKEHSGKPIEIDDKHKMKDLHNQVVMNKVLQDLQMAQMDYSDLMRQVDSAMAGEMTPPSAAPNDADDNNAESGSTIIQ